MKNSKLFDKNNEMLKVAFVIIFIGSIFKIFQAGVATGHFIYTLVN